MQLAIRSMAGAGAALLTAAVVATSPLAPTAHEIHVAVPDVQLSASVQGYYDAMAQAVISNTQGLISHGLPQPFGLALAIAEAQPPPSIPSSLAELWSVPSAVLYQLTTTAPEQIVTALSQLQSNQFDGAVNSLMGVPVAVLRPILFTNPVVGTVIMGLAGPVISGIGASVSAAQDIFDSLGSHDLQKIGTALGAAPAIVLDGILNGGYGPDLSSTPGSGPVVLAGGLLSPGSSAPGKVVLAGPIGVLQRHPINLGAAKKTVASPAAASAASPVRVKGGDGVKGGGHDKVGGHGNADSHGNAGNHSKAGGHDKARH
jgi:hypothetical protein